MNVILPCYIVIFIAFSFFQAWRRATLQVVTENSEVIADRLAEAVRHRLSAMPCTKKTLLRPETWLSEKSFIEALQSTRLGGGIWARRVARFAIKRLPWSTLLIKCLTENERQFDGRRLKFVLSQRIEVALSEAAMPSLWPMALCSAVLVALLAYVLFPWLI